VPTSRASKNRGLLRYGRSGSTLIMGMVWDSLAGNFLIDLLSRKVRTNASASDRIRRWGRLGERGGQGGEQESGVRLAPMRPDDVGGVPGVVDLGAGLDAAGHGAGQGD